MAADPYRYFRSEARELVDELGQGVLDLERGLGAADLVSRLLRAAHTLKGAARVVKQLEIAEGAHAVEEVLAAWPGPEAPDAVERIATLLRRLDEMGARVAALSPSGPAPTPEPSGDGARSIRVDLDEVAAILGGVRETEARLGALRSSLTAAPRVRRLAETLATRLGVSRHAPDASASALSADILDLSRELRDLATRIEHDGTAGLEAAERELRGVRGAVERLRLVPAGALFGTLARTARDAALAVGNDVVFEGRGGDTRLEAHLVEAARGALVQAVRNAVAHGIEGRAERRAVGKPPAGRVMVEVVRRARWVVYRCRDDGRGVDLAGVRRAAEGRGVPPEEIAGLDAGGVLGLLFRGRRLSTAAGVSEVAGRGVGLDVVRAAVERLGGEARLETEAGRGTTLEIELPLSIAALEALEVEAAGTVVAIPLDAVRRAVWLAPRDVVRAPRGASVALAEGAAPFLALAGVLGEAPSGSGEAPRTAVVVAAGNELAVVGVDRIRGTSIAVLRPLPAFAPACPLVAGATLDDLGDPRLVLDPEALVRAAQRGEEPRNDLRRAAA